MTTRTWIKICGLTTEQAVAAALDQQVDAIGFVFATSPRRVAPASAARLAAPARGRVACVAVTRQPTQAQIDEIVSIFRPDVLQTDVEDLEGLSLPPGLPVLPVLRSGSATAQPLPDRLLFEGPMSGAGMACDWESAERLARMTELVLAGGLTPDNVATAIQSVRPFGVDVSSGVESSPGIKSPVEIQRFVSAVRSATQECV